MRWLGALFDRRRRYRDLAISVEEHIEEKVEELVEGGMPRREAERTARRAFGNPTLIEERSREVWQWRMVEQVWADLRFAVRQMMRSPRFAIAAVATLAVGIGAQTTIYSVIHAVLIDPFPYRDAMRMVHLHLYDKEPSYNDLSLDGPQFREFEKSPVLDGAIAEDLYTMSLTGEELPEQLSVGRITPNAFQFFGVPALLGRTFGPADNPQVAVLSYAFWNAHYAGRPDVIGKTIELNRQAYTVIGVMPQRFTWEWSDALIPLVYSADPGRAANVYARMRAGISDAAAEQALEPMLDAFARETPANFPQKFKVHLMHINEVAVGRFRGVLIVLFIAVSFLLVLACVNVAILQLARSEARQAEIAMRKALGAGKTRIVAQLVTESVLLSVMGGSLGVALAFGGIRVVLYLTHPLTYLFPSEAKIAVNIPVLLFSLAVSILTGVVCGLWPAVRVSRTELRHTIDSSANKLAGRKNTRLTHRVLLTAQVAITVLLMACCGATLRKLSQLIDANLGYEPRNLASVNLVMREGAHDQWADRVEYCERIRNAIASDPSVVSASIGFLPPGVFDSTPVSVPGRKDEGGQGVAMRAGAEYFSTVGIPLLRGRMWTASEVSQGARVALINEAMRRRYWPDTDPIGQTVVLNHGLARQNAWKLVAPTNNQHYQVIGVVGDSPNKGLDEEVAPGVYIPFSMVAYDGFNIVFRSRENPANLLHAIKEHVKSVDGSQAVGDLVRATDLLESDSLGRERFVASLFSAFACLGLAFAAGGLFSIQSYLVAQRRRELGLRIALGAGKAEVVREVTRSSAVAVLYGTAVGLFLSMTLGQTFAEWTKGDAREPVMLAMVTVVLFVAAALASAGPALTATSIAPADALRSE